MHIVILMDELAPYHKDSLVGADIAALSEQFVNLGHEVTAILPMPKGLDPSAFSLARRLTPLTCELGGEVFKAARYDGLTTYGVAAHMLDFGDSLASGDTRLGPAFVQAALGTIQNIASKVDWCISYEGTASHFPEVAKDSKIEFLKGCQHHVIVTGLEADVESTLSAVASADQLSLTMAAAHAAVQKDLQPIADMIKIGAATVLPQPVESTPPSVSALKDSAKVALQLASGLPVNNQVPVFYLNQNGVDDLAKTVQTLLTKDTQIVVDANATALLEQVGKRYEDRLAVAPAGYPLDDILRAVDCCIAGADERVATRAVSMGVVPIVTRDHSGRFVDLDDQLMSGAAFVIDNNTSQETTQAAGRFLAAYGNHAAFDALVSRLYRYALTWEQAAKQHLQLMNDQSQKQ